MANQTILTIKKGEGRSLKAGGSFIYDNEVASIRGTFKNGEIIDVEDFDGYPMGKGYINQNSKIRVRMLTRDSKAAVIDEEFFRRRVQAAWNYRKNVCDGGMNLSALTEEEQELLKKGIGNTGRADLGSCRLIFGEADFLPGITVDKYQDFLVVEALTLGIEPWKGLIEALLVDTLMKDGILIRGIYERNDAKEREKEGLKREKKRVLLTECLACLDSPSEELLDHARQADRDLTEENFRKIEIMENGVHYMIDVIDGQKTGFFLDQKYNRKAMQRLCEGKRVLDCFSHMGTFALNAGIAGAKEVAGLDISQFAVDQARANAVRNGLSDRVNFRCANVLEELPRLCAAGEKYDVVILDPPAFTKSKDATKNAIKGYREINIKGLKLVENGGFFATCSCSHFMTAELLEKTVKEAAKAAHKRLRQIEFRTQGPDHPILWSAVPGTPESYYLKFFIFQVCDTSGT